MESQTFSFCFIIKSTKMELKNSENFSPSQIKNNQNYFNIPSLRLSSKSVISPAISSRSYKKESPKFQNYIAQESQNWTFKRTNKQMKVRQNEQTPEDEDRTRISINQESENLNQQSYLVPMEFQLRNKRSKSTTISQKNLEKIKNQRNSESIKSSFPTFSLLENQFYEKEISQRRQLIQKTKKQVQEFNQKNFKLLDDIKKIRQQMSKRTSLNWINKKPLQPNEKTKRKNSLIGLNSYQKKEIFQQKQKEEQKKLTDDDFIIFKKSGSGTFAKVFLAIEKNTGFLVTLKKISRNILKTQKSLQQIITEIKIQTFLDHPNVLKIYGFYVDSQNVTLILELMQQGNLYEKIMKQGPLRQEQASQSMSQILFALEHLHQNNIVYRDLKPQNILLSHGVRKLCDFGTANICEDRRSTLCGTLDYSAPQLIEGKQYNIALDMWSIGVITYELLTSKTPFYRIRRKDTIKEISQYQDGQLQFPQNISFIAQKFIMRFLVKDPQKRIKIKDALNEEFIIKFLDDETRQLRQKYENMQQKTI